MSYPSENAIFHQQTSVLLEIASCRQARAAYSGETEQQGKLILRLPPLGAYYELSHWGGNIYTYYIANEVSGAARRGVCFSGDGNEVTVENLDFECSKRFQESAVTSNFLDRAGAPRGPVG